VIKRGFALKRDVILPVRYVVEVFDDVIRVNISDTELDQLKNYDDDSQT
jgi:hypothetical protein